MLGIAKALASSPRLLVMDEPSAGLSPLFVGQVIAVLARFRASGLAMLIAGQNIAFLDLADRVYTLDGGRIRFEGSVAELEADDSLRRTYFGLA
jgi:branched-chain amino acid transport system ATP-binding protein